VDRLSCAGAIVAIADLNTEEAKSVPTRLGRGAFALHTDVAQLKSIEQTVAAVLQRTDQIDILVNNAGIAGRAAPLWEQTTEDWQAAIDINLSAIFYFCRSVMRQRRYGRIVNIASIAGKEGNPRMVPYSTKAGVIGLTKSLGKEVATDGICVNAVSPAVVQTRILDQLTPEQVNYMTERIPMRRTG